MLELCNKADVKEGSVKSRYRVTLDADIDSIFHANFNAQDLVNFTINFPNPNEAHLYVEQGGKRVEFKKIDIEEMGL